MANRNSGLTAQKKLAASAAGFVLLAISLPALGASSNKLLCDEEEEANLDVPVEKLTAIVVDHDVILSTVKDIAIEAADRQQVVSRLLAPRAEAAIRDAFGESDLEDEHPAPDLSSSVLSRPVAGVDTAVVPENNESPQEDPVSGMNTQLPGVSEDDLSRFKKQMYRRDI
ncbi:MAG: hypothetical protein K0U72_05075 [Gammaproteobacteria bacterium]|nr:hypothetical protein [Gammaproteobacteria bacterium]